MIYTTGQGYLIRNTQIEDAEALDALQQHIFPTLAVQERLAAPHFRHHIGVFPQGQLVVLDGSRVVASSAAIRYHLDLGDHRFMEVSDQLWFNTHEPEGTWLYGMDMGVHPDYRGQGLARAMYRVRQMLCRALGLQGQITVGMLNGYAGYAAQMSVEAYYAALMAGRLQDPTVSAQQKIGFRPVRLIQHYLDDPQCGNSGVLMTLAADCVV